MNDLKKFKYTSILGWSVSRYETFSKCKRFYFYTYYSKFDKDYSHNKIIKLKSLTSIPLETGNIVHNIIKDILERLIKSENEIDRNKFFDYSRKKTNQILKNKNFSEIYYKELKSIDHKILFDKIKQSLINLIDSERFNWIFTNAINSKNKWIIEPPGYGETRINNLKAYCKVDFLFPREDKIFIIDWKTGKHYELKHNKQLLGYTTWAKYQFDFSSKNIKPIIAYLFPIYEEIELEVDENKISEFTRTVEKETSEMYKFCMDIEKNIPIEKNKFILTENSAICKYCNFRELCSR